MNSPAKSKAALWFGRLLFVFAGLITLIALLYAEENWRGERDWNAYRRQMEAKGMKFDLAAFIPPRVPDDQNFAMTPFLAPLFDLQPGTNKPRDTNSYQRASTFGNSMPSVSGHWLGWKWGEKTDLAGWRTAFKNAGNDKPVKAKQRSPQELAEAAPVVLEALKPYEAVIEELRTASRRPYSRYNVNYAIENPIAIVLPHLGTLRRAAMILELRASAELSLGRTAEAFDDIGLMIHLADSLDNEPILVSHLVRAACLDLATQVTWEGLIDHRWSDAQAQTLQNRFQGEDLLADYTRAVAGERCAFGNTVFEFLIQSPKRGEFLSAAGGGAPNTTASFLFGLVPRGWWRFEQLSYHHTLDGLCMPGPDLAARRVYPQQSESSMKIFEASCKSPVAVITSHRVLSNLLVPALNTCLRKFANAQVVADEAAIACALERCRLADGRYPDLLDALVPRFMAKLPHDIITGAPLKYRREGDGYILYSVGWNEKDDGGKVDEKGELNRGDWVWQCPANK
jgi:hypothetical protein